MARGLDCSFVVANLNTGALHPPTFKAERQRQQAMIAYRALSVK